MRRIVRVTENSLARYSVGLLAASAALLLAWPGLAANLLATETAAGGFMPHIHCYLWVPSLVVLHASTDLLIGLSYVAISLTLVVLIHRTRRDIPFHWVFLAFGLFIVACGMTHFMGLWNLYNPHYWLSGYVKLVTAAASVATAVILPPLLPRAVTMVVSAKAAEGHRLALEKAHAELEALYARVKESDELKTRFFANVSHELRTPLALILGPIERLQAAPNLTPEQRRTVETLDLHARGLLKQVSDLLDISKIEAGRMAPDYRRVDLSGLLRLAASHFESLAMERDIRFQVEAPEGSVGADADAEKLQRVFLNLLANAFKFTPPEGRVRCRLFTEEDGGHAVIEVEDTGPGVAPELRERVFERYGHSAHELTRRFGGTGLGLAISKEFVELHGGTLTVDDAPAGGALFRVRIPLAARPSGAASAASAGAPGAQDQGELLAGTAEAARQTISELRAAAAADERPRGDEEADAAAEAEGAAEVASSPPSAAAEGAGAEGTDRRAASGAAAASAPLVLVVEDNAEMNRFIADALGGSYRVVSAFDGEEGLRRALALRPDLILSDVMMPRLSGDLLLREVRERRELDDVPVMMLTAKADDEVRVGLLRSGAQDFLMKPFSVEELRARVGQQVSIKRTRELLQQELASRGRGLEELAAELASAHGREQEARRLAEDASRLKDEFLATVSHELRLPLTPILGWSQMLLAGGHDEASTRRALETIARNAAHQRQIVDDLLDVSRIISGKLRFDPRPVALGAVVESAAESLRPATEAKRLRLDLDLDRDAHTVRGDTGRLQQVFWNLLSNAVKFTPEGGEVRARAAREGGRVIVTVSDTGQGISRDFLPHVFDRFRQQDGTTTRQHGGLGLGLAIVRHIVELHGGTVRAESEGEGRGATFVVSLPAADAAVGEEPAAAATEPASAPAGEEAPRAGVEPPGGRLAGLRVLVVDDDEDAREMVAAMLTRAGAQVLKAGGAHEGFELLMRERPSLLVSDIGMPGEDGYSLVERVRGLGARAGFGGLPALALTAHTRPQDRERAKAAGFDAHVMKPVAQEELVEAVARLARRA